MKWQWIGLALFSLTLLPTGLAMASDRVPRRLRGRLAPVRPRGWALLSVYAVAPVNAIPRLAGASSDVTLAATATGGALVVAGSLVLGFATHWPRPRRVAAGARTQR
ncbi:hypothetical protein [Streptomyces vinaceus]|uniref:hypothetical protein n=1 Tax=Streptomyces vinaceus TaxID=1960 RepID=UPI003684EDB3